MLKKLLKSVNIFAPATSTEIAKQQIQEVAEGLAKLEHLAQHYKQLSITYEDGVRSLRNPTPIELKQELRLAAG